MYAMQDVRVFLTRFMNMASVFLVSHMAWRGDDFYAGGVTQSQSVHVRTI